MCIYWVCLCITVRVHTRVCRLEHSVSAGIVRWHHVCLSERRGEGRRGSWFAWGRERLGCVYSLPAPKADSSRDTADREQQKGRGRQAGRKEGGRGEGRKREQERGESGRTKEREGIRFNHYRKSDSSHNTSHGEYHIDLFARKATGGYIHTHTHTCTFSQRLSLTHITPITVTQTKARVGLYCSIAIEHKQGPHPSLKVNSVHLISYDSQLDAHSAHHLFLLHGFLISRRASTTWLCRGATALRKEIGQGLLPPAGTRPLLLGS